MSNKLRRQVVATLRKSNLRRLASLGQNFLVDQETISKICQAVVAEHPEVVLEIGPGLGALTFPLALAVKRLVAVELDHGLAKKLVQSVPANVSIQPGDIRKQDLANLGLAKRKYTACGSLPFNTGAAILRWLLENDHPPQVIYVILQKEVIDRILAKDKRESIISLAIRFYGRAELLFTISRRAYQPQPRVDTGFLRVDCSQYPPHIGLKKPFFTLVKAGFASKRKYLSSNLTRNLKLPRQIVEKALIERHLSLKIRAEALSFEDWLDLARKLPS